MDDTILINVEQPEDIVSLNVSETVETITINVVDQYSSGLPQDSGNFDPIGSATNAQNFAIQRANHTGYQSADTLTDGSLNKAFTAAEKITLANLISFPGFDTTFSAAARGNHVHTPQVNITGNAATATSLQNTITINGVPFNGTQNVTITADVNSLTTISGIKTFTGVVNLSGNSGVIADSTPNLAMTKKMSDYERIRVPERFKDYTLGISSIVSSNGLLNGTLTGRGVTSVNSVGNPAQGSYVTNTISSSFLTLYGIWPLNRAQEFYFFASAAPTTSNGVRFQIGIVNTAGNGRIDDTFGVGVEFYQSSGSFLCRLVRKFSLASAVEYGTPFSMSSPASGAHYWLKINTDNTIEIRQEAYNSNVCVERPATATSTLPAGSGPFTNGYCYLALMAYAYNATAANNTGTLNVSRMIGYAP